MKDMERIHDEPVSHLLTKTNIIASVICYVFISIIVSFWRAPRYPTSLPWVGHGKGWFAAIRNTFGAFTNTEKWIQEGYTKYSKNDRSFVLPGGLGGTAEVVIPRSETRWMLDQPDDVLSSSAAHYDILIGEYNFVDKVMLGDPYHEHVIHKNIARNLNGLIPIMNEGLTDDVNLVVKKMIGDSDDWKSINLLEFFLNVIPRNTNRMIIGEPVCRNGDYLHAVASFMMDVVRGMFIFAVFPQALHPIVGFFAGLVPKYHYWRSSRHSLPVIRKRLVDIQRKEDGDPEYKDWTAPNDFITWTIKTARAEGRNDELQPSRIAKRIMTLNFAGIHTTSITGHGTILDIMSSDFGVLESLREEAARVYTEEGNQWTKAGLSRMYRMDSAIRESQRYSSFAQTFVHRKVVNKEGITTPDGVHCAPGTLLVSPWGPMSRDNDVHGTANKYDAFRFSRDREIYEALSPHERDRSEALKVRQNGQVTTSDKHLPFGHGRHACPGRFFVSYSQKIMFGHLILNYDIKHLSERPSASWIGRNFVPPTKAQIEIRRRESMWTVEDAR